MSEVDEYGRSPLHYAALANDLDAAGARVAAGDDPNLRDVNGLTPLHFAAQESAAEVAALLLSAGAEVDGADVHGNTPLMTAVFESRGRGDLIELLRANGADPFRPNASGQTPVGLARLIGNYDVARFFADLPDE
jgi:ankyrin repeat protein